jgi:hypothetical protein
MDRWFISPVPTIAESGDFERSDLILDAGKNQREFLKEFGHLVIDYYTAPLRSLIALGTVPSLDLPAITRRLFTESGDTTEVFRTFAGEVLAVWVEQSFTHNAIERKPKPHDTTPCFDAVSLGQDQGKAFLCFIQAKTTSSNIQNNANSAAESFGKLDSGEYAIELADAVEEVAGRQPNEDDKKAILKTLIDPSCRRFRVVIIHEIEAPDVALSKYCNHVPGDRCRRHASFLQLLEWEQSWQSIGRSAYAKVNAAGSS